MAGRRPQRRSTPKDRVAQGRKAIVRRIANIEEVGGRDLLRELRPPGVDDHELTTLLINHFGGSASGSASGYVLIPSGGDVAVRIEFEADRIKGIEAGPGLDGGTVDELKEKIRSKLLDSPGDFIATGIIFSSFPTDAPFRSTTFQLMPPPSHAPQPKVLLAQHPLIIEYQVRGSSDPMTSFQRAQDKLMEFVWILNALLRAQISTVAQRFMWAACRDPLDMSPFDESQVRWVRESYMIDGFPAKVDAFSDPTGRTIQQVPHENYYGPRIFITPDRTLAIPDSLTDLVTRASSLAPRARRRFLIAAQWLYAAGFASTTHQSTWFTNLVTAIEALMEGDMKPDRCPTCGLDRFGPTRRFKEFVERYSRHPDPAAKGLFYKTRSNLLHGKTLFSRDEFPTRPTFNSKMSSRPVRPSTPNGFRNWRSAINWNGSPAT